MRCIVHLDLDSFFVSVERLATPELQHRPVLIGGGDRGVVASCSYEARKFGVHSAMPMKLARQLCPEAIVIRGDMERYSKYSRLVTDIIADSAPMYEKSSIDEFYLDITGMDRFLGAGKWAAELRKRIIVESGLPISMGISINKTVAKIATGEAKPSGHLSVESGSEKPFLAPLPVKRIPMIGPKTEQSLYRMGVRRILTLQEMPPEVLAQVFGKSGISIWKKANGIDNSKVEPYTERKQISSEKTFEQDSMDIDFIRRNLIEMTSDLAAKLRREGKLTGCVRVKIRYANFDTHTRQTNIPYTSLDHHLIPQVKSLFDKLYQRRMRIRLVGVSLTSLIRGHYQINLFDDTSQIQLYQALDKMNNRWGKSVVRRGA
ncbi:MAG: DNA polymerase IV [Cryomorphaceae bacterium]|nr:DNA polymerase IV [Cryomorphaceae bacterium]